MALRHLYSRVPAKASMFNLTDSYDTFAKSQKLDKDFILCEMGRLFEYAPGKTESEMILDGFLPPTYCTLRTPEGVIVHSSITYQQRDFTGERYSFMINSLVLEKDEKGTIYSKKEAAYFNPDIFTEKIESFDITSQTFSPVSDYPETPYETEKLRDISEISGEYDERVIKRLIFALLYVSANKNKCVYIAPLMPPEELSRWGLEFINALMQLFPAFIRERLSFITFITEYKKLNCFNVKFVHSDDIQAGGKGFVFDMTPGKPDNIKEGDYKQFEKEVTFLYELCEDKERRDSFTAFCDNMVKADSEYDKPGLQTFADMVLLFRQSRYEGEVEENDLIANDQSCFKLISTYESHRNALELNDRLNILAPLIVRYCFTRSPIPSNVFSKLTKLYSKEPFECRVVIMNGLLELIHTDAMREKLFAFIKNVFDDETAERREVICENLSRVFYGGFLQDQILTLFDTVFEGEIESSKTNILSKLLLSIRTESIRDKVFEFLKNHAVRITGEHREMVYTALLEAVPVKDITSSKAVETIDYYSKNDTPALQNELSFELYSMLEENDSLIEILITDSELNTKGPVSFGVIKRIIRNNIRKKLFSVMLSLLVGNKLTGISNAVEAVWLFDDTDPESINKALFEKLKPVFETVAKNATLEDMISLYSRLDSSPLKVGDYRKAMYNRFCQNCLFPLMGENYIKALDPRLHTRPIIYYADYAEKAEGIASYDGVKTVTGFSHLIKAVNAGSSVEILNCLFGFEIPAAYVPSSVYRLKAECKGAFEISSNNDTKALILSCSSGAYAAILASVEYIEHKRISLTKLFDENLKVLDKRLQEDLNSREDKPKNLKKALQEAHDEALMRSLEGLIRFCKSLGVSNAEESFKQKLCYDSVSELDYTLVAILNDHFKNLKKEVFVLSHTLKIIDPVIAEKVKQNFSKKAVSENPDNQDQDNTKGKKSKLLGLFKK